MDEKPSGSKYGPPIDLRGIEARAWAEGMEQIRRRIEDLVREEAEAFSPGGGEISPSPAKT